MKMQEHSPWCGSEEPVFLLVTRARSRIPDCVARRINQSYLSAVLSFTLCNLELDYFDDQLLLVAVGLLLHWSTPVRTWSSMEKASCEDKLISDKNDRSKHRPQILT